MDLKKERCGEIVVRNETFVLQLHVQFGHIVMKSTLGSAHNVKNFRLLLKFSVGRINLRFCSFSASSIGACSPQVEHEHTSKK